MILLISAQSSNKLEVLIAKKKEVKRELKLHNKTDKK